MIGVFDATVSEQQINGLLGATMLFQPLIDGIDSLVRSELHSV